MSTPHDTAIYSFEYWKALSDGYQQGGLDVPPEVIEGMNNAIVAKQARAALAAAEWMVVDDGGREMARIIWAESGNKVWAKNILNAMLQSFNLFKNGPLRATGANYLTVKNDCDVLWATMLSTHRRTKKFTALEEWMVKHGYRHHSYPKEVQTQFCQHQGWEWTTKMKIGSGTTVHLRPDEVPENALVSISGTLLAVVEGKLYVPAQEWIDLDITRGGTRAVYGWWTKVVS